MVDLSWKDKKDVSRELESLKTKYSNYYKEISFDGTKLDNNNARSSSNKLYWGENFDILCHLLNEFQEKVDLVYIDPPFFSGANYHVKIEGVEDDRDYTEQVAYEDCWNNDLDTYLQMLYERIQLIYQLLSKTGLIFIHLDWHASHYIRAILDEVFGEKNFINCIIWYYYNKYSAGKYNLPRAHDDILVYSKSSKYTFNELRVPREKPIKQLKRRMVNGVLKNAKDEDGHVIYRIVTDKKEDDVWKIPCLQPASKQWTGYPTQKHHELLKRIIELGTKEGDLVSDFFCGSGTTLLTAEKLKRRWIGCDASEIAIYLTRKRILEYHEKLKDKGRSIKPFQIFARMDVQKQELLDGEFFNKELTIKRKK